MPRATIPHPIDLREALIEMGIDISNMIGIKALRRIYDRETGNFKATGWLCQITFLTDEPIEIGIPDRFIRFMVQSRF